MAPTISGPRTIGATDFNPDILLLKWGQGQQTLPEENDLRTSLIRTFSLPHSDTYVYHAIASVTLAQVQEAINHGGEAGLHAWYRDTEGKPLPPPTQTDIAAYTSIFAPHTVTTKALTGFASNAKKDSVRKSVAEYLLANRSLPAAISIPKSKSHANPYYDFWKWSCENLEWCGPEANTVNVKTSHHVLPLFMHHFGCVVPSYESLEVIKHVAGGKEVVDLGSGNGYWTYMLRRHGIKVHAIDNLQSSWRTMWIGDTIVKDGDKYLRDGKGFPDKALLLVYPIVGSDFTSIVVEAYKGTTLIVAGTQNRNGYTAFKDRTIDEWMEKERGELGWKKTLQIPLPSFAGKDEALFVFEKHTEAS